MAPLGMVGMFGNHFATLHPLTALLSLLTLSMLSIFLIAMCLKCKRNSGNAYDVDGAQSQPEGGASSAKKGVAEPEGGDYGWRGHKDMPPSTLEREAATE